jgi:tellurite resistance protein TehA-like permease
MQDAYIDWMATIYFVLCIVICAFFLLNLTVAVMLKKYDELDKNEADSKHKKELRDDGVGCGLDT